MSLNPEWIALSVLVAASLAEWLHSRRSQSVARLAFGPAARARSWTLLTPGLRVLALVLLAWGFTNLTQLTPRLLKPPQLPQGGYRHILILLDVSPSMQLKDAGATREFTRAQRAAELTISMLERVALDQVRISVVAFYNGAKPVVLETRDLAVVENILKDLPLDYAFDIGKTTLMDGIRQAFEVAAPWPKDSTTLILLSDGDTIPDSGMPPLPPSIARVLVVGVGDPRAGKFIDGHQSRQDASTLRQIAHRLHGYYHDGNEKHLPSEQLSALAEYLPMRRDIEKGRRELSLAALGVGGFLLAGLPLTLAMAGSRWQHIRKAVAADKVQTRSPARSELPSHR